jgi:hypothetical protein
MLLLAKQTLDEAPYKLSGAVAKLAGITFSRLSSSYWIDNLGFITEGKLAAIFIKTFSWGFSTGRSFTTHSHVNLAPEVFCRRCRVLKKKLSHHHHRAINKFSGAVAGEEKKTSARGVSHTHPLLCFKFFFTLFLLASFYQKPQKN